jgi:hypothetical protein
MPSAAPTPITDDQVSRVVAAWRATRTPELTWLLEAVGADTIAEMSSSQAVRALSLLQRRRLEKTQAEA